MLSFQQQDCELTLEEGLREYYASHPDLADGRGMSESAREFFRCHDTAHVVFGCSTELSNEGMVKLWSFFGTTGGLRLLRDYGSPESKEIYATLDLASIVETALRAIVFVPRVLRRCMRMSKRWPWHDFDQQLGRPLCEIRREWGIAVLTLP